MTLLLNQFRPADLGLPARTGLVLANVVLRYLLFAGGAYLFFYVWKRRQWLARRIQPRFPTSAQIRQEIGYSLLTAGIFAAIFLLVFAARKAGLTRIYADVHQYGWGYLALSIGLLVLLHDTYFYWTHRLMHHPRLFRYVHRVHHLSHNPSPWAAYAFHPLEAIIEAGILPLAVLALPVHPLALLIFGLYTLTFNVIGHLGYELLPPRLHGHWLGRWQNTSTHHNLHHQLTKGNYGLYFNFWDTWMGTNHRLNEERYQQATGAPRQTTAA